MPLTHVSPIANVAIGYLIPLFVRRFDPLKYTNKTQDICPFSISLVGFVLIQTEKQVILGRIPLLN